MNRQAWRRCGNQDGGRGQALQRVGEHVYKQDAPGDEGPQAPDDGSGSGPDDTVEGEYREM